MSESTFQKLKKQPTVTKIDTEVYKRLCEVVEAGTFQSISFSPWHKGCDTELDATCQWPELEGELENWYYDNMGDMEPHTYAMIIPIYCRETLSFKFVGDYDRGRDQEADICWDEGEFQEFVHSLLPSALRKNTNPENLWISLELEYESPQQSSISDFSISLEGEDEDKFTTSITPKKQNVIRDYVIAWCFKNHGPEDSFGIRIESNAISSVVTSCVSEEFLLIPKKAEEADS